MKKMTLLILCFLMIKANGQNLFSNDIHYDIEIPINTQPLPSNTEFIDRWGYPFNDSNSYFKSIIPTSKFGGVTAHTCSRFKLVFADEIDNTQFGFDDTTKINLPVGHPLGVSITTIGSLRRWTICKVFDYVSNTLFIPNGVEPDIYISHSLNSGLSTLAAASTSYKPTASTGFIGGCLRDYIVTGVNYTPNANEYDGKMFFDFGYRQSGIFNNDAAVTNTSNYDLFSIALHEVTHILGFNSLIQYNGLSGIYNNNPGIYSLLDRYILDSTNARLIDSATYLFQSQISKLTSNTLNYFKSSNSNKYSIYSPIAWYQGSSLSHFDNLRDNVKYVMSPDYTGVTRIWTNGEFEALCNMGYTFGSSASTPFVCDNTYAIGVDDDTTTAMNTAVSINVIFNDYDLGGKPIKLDTSSVALVSGQATFATNGNSITVMPTTGTCGLIIIKYRPYTPSTNSYGSYAYLRVSVSCLGFCPVDVCNLICNGSFENGVTVNQFDYLLQFNTCQSFVLDCNVATNWKQLTAKFANIPNNINVGSCDFFIRNSTYNAGSFGIPINNATWGTAPGVETPNGLGDRYLGCFIGTSSGSGMESFYTQLISPLVPNQQYRLIYKARAVELTNTGNYKGTPSPYFKIAFSANTPICNNSFFYNGTSTTFNSDSIQIVNPNNPSNIWTTCVDTFTAINADNYLVFEPRVDFKPTNLYVPYILLDDVRLEKLGNQINTKVTVNKPNPKIGDTVQYTITVCNESPVVVNNIGTYTTIDSGLSVISHTFSKFPKDTIASLQPNQCSTYTVIAKVENSIALNTNINTCTYITTLNACHGSNAQNCASVNVIATDISIATEQVNCNSFKVLISNVGNQDAHNVVVNYTPPACMGTVTPHFLLNNLVLPILTKGTTFTKTFTSSGVLSTNCNNIVKLLHLDETDIVQANNDASIILGGFESNYLGANPTITCGQSITLGQPLVTGFSYSWTSSTTGNTVISTIPVITVSPTTSTTYILKITRGTCTYTYSITVTIAIPNPTITGNSTICTNTLYTYITSVTGGTWSISNLSNGAAATINPTTGVLTATASGTVTIQYTANNSCGTSAYVTKVVTVNPKPSLILSAQQGIVYCNNNPTIDLSASSNAINPSYTWTTPYTYTTATNLGNTTTVTENVNNYGSFSFKVQVKDGANCSSNLVTKLYTILSSYTQCNPFSTCTSLTQNLNAGDYTGNTKYCCTENVIVLPSATPTTFTNSEILMSANRSITVSTGATLKLLGCHLYSCDEMWQGIIVQKGGTLIIDDDGSNEVGKKSSFIEDAKIAVDLTLNRLYDGSYTGRPPVILKVNNTIFNRNDISINITGTNDPSTLSASYINIGNSIFTSRNISFSGLNWATVDALKTNSNIGYSCLNTPNTLYAPYINNTLYPADNCGAFLKSPYNPSSNKPTAGIKLNYASFITSAVTIGNPIINGTNCNTTIFDNLSIGISNNNYTALNVKNCSFQNGWANGLANAGIGIYGVNCDAAITINTDISLNEPRNAFWDLQYAVKTANCSNVIVGNADLRSSRNVQATNNVHKRGSWGVYIEGSKLDYIDVRSNTLINIENGVKINNTAPTSNTANAGMITVGNNFIQADFNQNYTGTTQNVVSAITISTVNSFTSATNVNCSGNHLYKVFNGIVASAWKGKNIIADNNAITLKQYTIGTIKQKQYGIKVDGGLATVALGNQITNNTITGDFTNDAIVPEQTGIYIADQKQNFLGCNTVANLKDGFRFWGSNLLGTRFWDNTMQMSNKYGFTLDQGGVIGNVGVASGAGVALCTSNNIWEGTSAAWIANPNPLYKHYRVNCANNSDARLSKLYVKNGAAFNPDGAIAPIVPSNPSIPYSSTAAIPSIIVANGTRTCPRCTGIPAIAPPQQQNEYIDLQTLEEVATLDPDGATSTEEIDMIITSQQQLYDMLKADPTLIGQSFILQQFMSDNNYSSLDYSYLTGNALANGDYALATALLNTWATDGTPDLNSYTFYTWLYNMQTNSSYVIDTLAVYTLANQCPLTNGISVYAARNLYNSLTEQNLMFDNACDNTVSLSRKAPKPKPTNEKQETINGVSIYPNPTTGYVYINLPNTTTDKVCWNISVTNTLGKVIEEKKIKTKAIKTFVELKGNSGLYFIKVLNCTSGELEVKKVILQ